MQNDKHQLHDNGIYNSIGGSRALPRLIRLAGKIISTICTTPQKTNDRESSETYGLGHLHLLNPNDGAQKHLECDLYGQDGMTFLKKND